MSIIKNLSEFLDISVADLAINMVKAPITYKVFKIAKRTGGKRVIAQPTQFVKNVQRGIVSLLLQKFETLDSTMAYTKGRSIVDNANIHLNSKFLLKMDFKDFFPSITSKDFIYFLNKSDFNLPRHELTFLVNYLFIKTSLGLNLSIGAPSSPIISNIIMHDIDILIQEHCNANSVKYTRYADDLTFSSSSYDVLNELSKWIKELLANIDSPKLVINEKKTKIVGRSTSRRVTGVILTNEDYISVGRHNRKKIRAMLYQYKNNELNKKDIPYLHGIISHLRHVEPEHFQKLVKRYDEELFKTLAKKSYSIGKSNKDRITKNNN